MFATHDIAKGWTAALMLTLISSEPALAAAPIEYLEYNLTPYFNSMMGSSTAYQYWRPNSEIHSPYRGLFDYAPGAIVPASPVVEPAPVPSIGVPYLGYDLTRYYNLAPACLLSHIC